MYISVNDAFGMLRRIGADIEERREELRRAEQMRDQFLRIFDGQEGMGRTQMAEALGMTRYRVHQILFPNGAGADYLEDDAAVILPPDLYRSLTAAASEAEQNVARDGAVWLDVKTDA